MRVVLIKKFEYGLWKSNILEKEIDYSKYYYIEEGEIYENEEANRIYFDIQNDKLIIETGYAHPERFDSYINNGWRQIK